MNSQTMTGEKVHVWPRMLAGAALLTSTLAAIWSTLVHHPFVVWMSWLPVVIVAIPLFAMHRRQFRVACLAGAVLLLVLSIVGVFFALFMHLPAALILVAAAAAADPQWAPKRTRAAVVVGGPLSVMATVGWAGGIYRSALSPPDRFIVRTSPEFDVMEPPFRAIIEGDGSGIGFGANNVSVGGSGYGRGPTLHVGFPKDLSTDARERLRQHLLVLPGVTEVRLCNRLRHEC